MDCEEKYTALSALGVMERNTHTRASMSNIMKGRYQIEAVYFNTCIWSWKPQPNLVYIQWNWTNNIPSWPCNVDTCSPEIFGIISPIFTPCIHELDL